MKSILKATFDFTSRVIADWLNKESWLNDSGEHLTVGGFLVLAIISCLPLLAIPHIEHALAYSSAIAGVGIFLLASVDKICEVAIFLLVVLVMIVAEMVFGKKGHVGEILAETRLGHFTD